MAGLGEKIKQTVESGLHKVGGKSAAGKRILIVATSHDKLGDTNQPTGCWAEELAAPYYIFKDAGADVDVVSIKGGKIPIDEASLGEGFVTDHVKRYFGDAPKYAFNGISNNMIVWGDTKLASAALKLARHARTTGLRRGSDEHVGLVLELIEFAESACESPLICPASTQYMSDDRNFQDPVQYADSLLLLARDVDAHPWGAFGFTHPSKYLPFLQQLAGDLMDH